MYKLPDVSGGVVRLSDNALIPADPNNTDYQRYLRWLEEGNTPLPPDPPPPPPIPTSVTMRQARLALLQLGLLDDVEAAIASIPDEVQRRAAQIEWEYASTVERDSQWVQNLAGALGLSGEQLDQLFHLAATL